MPIVKIERIRWTPDRVAHIARHGLTLDEVEEAVFDDLYGFTQVLKTATRDPNQRVYRFLGRTEGGKYITFIFIYEGRGTAYPVTARSMTKAERRRYSDRRGGL